MRHFYLRLSTAFYIALALVTAPKVFAQQPRQQLTARNFAVFGGFPNANQSFLLDSTRFGVQLNSGTRVDGGAVGSYSFITSGPNATFFSDLYSGHRIDFGSQNRVLGNVTAGITVRQNISVITSLNTIEFGGETPNGFTSSDLNANGNIFLNRSSFGIGDVRIPAGNTYSGPSLEVDVQNNPVFPLLPALPPNVTWGGPGTGANINSTRSISPGTHGSVQLGGQQTITFNGPGRYIFDSIITNSSSQNTFVFDFKNNETGVFGLYINKNANLGNIKVVLVNGGSASRIYTEVRGTGLNNGYGFSIEGGQAFNQSNWEGTVWAPLSRIRIGGFNPTAGNQVTVNGCIWSSLFVALNGVTTINYVPLSIAADPSQTVTSPILPYYPPPANGKVNKIIGSELQSLFENYNPNLVRPNDFIFRIDKATNTVLMEVIAKEGQYAAVLTALTTTYGFTNLISNGEGSLIITGRCPIANLGRLNVEPVADKIDYCRPLFLPITNKGLTTTQGDSAIKAGMVRRGYDLSGAGVKVGVLSDSYDRSLPNPLSTPAANDLGVDLPSAVSVVLDYPFGTASDEGRAMMQIIHDVAPGAELAFRTGFISAGDMALGINELANTCKIIVDDVTYITEPFLKDGVLARAVNKVTAEKGVTYFSAAGNFGRKAYDGIFNGIQPPSGFSGYAHDFGGGNYLQPVKLAPGNYTIVLQWFDDIYSLGETAAGGARNDLDIYLVDNFGTILFGFNRLNVGGDPLEILPFTVNGNMPVDANLVIIKADGSSASIPFKYVVFRGEITFTNYQGASTLVGQANAQAAIAVGAVSFNQTPPYGITPVTIEPFSSIGGTLVNGVNRNKPDLTAPDNVNVTVNMGVDRDNPADGKSNFLGTSAAAPHAAAVAALISEGKQKFSTMVITPTALKTLLKTSATDIGTVGVDAVTGSGLINTDAAMRTFANPEPSIGSVTVVEPGIVPGTAPFTVSVKGENISSSTLINFNGVPITTAFVNATEVRGTIPAFGGNPALNLYTPPKSTSNLDGGYSADFFFGGVPKKIITITIDNKTKKFGEAIPAFTSTILVDGVSLATAGLTIADLKLNNLVYTTNATTTSNTGLYTITVKNPLDPALPADQLLLSKYTYEFDEIGDLSIQRLPFTLTPQDKTINYGDFLGEVTFNYVFDKTKMPDPVAIEQIIRTQHKKFLAENAIAVVNGFKLPQANGNILTNADLANMSTIASFQSVKNARKFILRNGQMIPLIYPITPAEIGSQRFIVDIAAQSIYNYKLNTASSPLVTAYPNNHARLLLGAKALATNAATTQLGNGRLQAMVNGQLLAMVNGRLQAIVNGRLMAIVNGELTVLEEVSIVNGRLQAIVNGETVIIPNGQLQAMVNGQLYLATDPLIVDGQLQAVVNGRLMAIVNGRLMAIVNGQLMPIVNGRLQAIVNGQLMPIVNGQLQPIVNGQLLAIVNGELLPVSSVALVNGRLQAIVNGQLQPIVNGQLQGLVNGEVFTIGDVTLANGRLQAIVNGQLLAMVNGRLQAIVNGQLQPIVNSNNLGGVNSNNNTAVIIDEDDITVQEGSLGVMFSVNTITGLEAGIQTLIPGAFGQENFDVAYGLGKVTILPAVEFYSKPSGELNNLITWGANPDGSGVNPTNFGSGKTFHLANRAPIYAMTANWTVDGILDIPGGSQLRLNGYTLSEAGLIGLGTLYGSTTSNLIVAGSSSGDAGLIYFEPGGGNLSNLAINRTGSAGSATIATKVNVFGVLTITRGILKTGNMITLKSDEVNTARVAPVGGSISGNVTVERFVPARRAWRLVSAPVGGTQSIFAAWQEGATTSSANPNPNPGYGTHITQGSAANGFDLSPVASSVSIKKYVSATDTWVPLTNTNATAVNSDAYLLFVRGDRGVQLGPNNIPPTKTVLRANGPLKTGDQTFAVAKVGFTAIPNPFASPINFATITRNNVQNNFYVWDPKLGGAAGVGGYVLLSSNGSGGYDITPAPVSPESQYIQSGQGFLVHSTGVAGNLVIKESDKSATASTNVFRSVNSTHGLRITLRNNTKKNDETVLDEIFSSYGQAFSNEVDNMDALKLDNVNENLAIRRNQQTLMLERRKQMAANDTIHLNMSNMSQKSYVFELKPVNLSASLFEYAFLEDNYLKTSTPVSLSEDTRFNFNVDENVASAEPGRFRVILSARKSVLPTGVDITKGTFKISPNPLSGKLINIQFLNQPRGDYSVELRNNLGQTVYQGKVKHEGGTATRTLQLNNNIVQGAYQLKVANRAANIVFAIPVLSN